MLTTAERQRRIEIIRQFPAAFEALVQGLDEADLHTAYLAGEWTVAQNVHHVADSHMNAFIRVKLGLTETHPTIRPYDQEAWAETADSKNLPVGVSLRLLKALHERWCILWESLDEADWTRPVHHPENGEMTIEDFLVSYSDHGQAHIDQIQKTLAAKVTL